MAIAEGGERVEQPREPKFYPDEQWIPISLAGEKDRTLDKTVKIEISSESLDRAIEKVNRLIEYLQKAQQIIGSLSGKGESGF